MRERRRERAASAERSAASSAAASPLIPRPPSPAAPSPAASSSPSPARAAAKQAARERAPWPENASQPPSPADVPTPPAAPSAPAPMPMPATPPAPMPATPAAPAPAPLVSPASRRSHVTPAAQRTVDLDAAAAPTPATTTTAPVPTRRCAGLLYTKAARGDEPGTETWRLRWHAFDGNVLRWRDPEATEWLGAIRLGPNARCRRGASREDGYVALDVACDDWAATLLAPSRDERRRWLAALDPRPVPSRPTPKKLVLKSTPRRPPDSPPSTPSPSTTDFEALLPLTHRERSRAAAVARAVDAYLETRSGRARKVVVEAARRSAPLADEVYCRLLLVCTDQAWELLGAVADCRAPSDAALCGVVREAAVGARVMGVVGAMDAALEAFSSAA